jgi:two-component system chemotaxis response regulator CheB
LYNISPIQEFLIIRHHFVSPIGRMAKQKNIVVIGTSAGGSLILPVLLKQLTKDMDIAVLIVIHLSRHSIGEMLVSRLQKETSLTCKMPRHGETIKANHVYMARPDHHLMVKDNKILLGKGPMENRYRPSIDSLFRSAAASYGPRVIGIILTGMLEDGAGGMLAIKRSGGICMIQDPNEAKYPDMPRAVLNVLQPDFSLPVTEMGKAIAGVLASRKKRLNGKIPEDIKQEAQLAERVYIGIDKLKELGDHSLFSCPDCGGGLWEMETNGYTRYRCHVGHAFTEQSLLGGMESSTESALWTALRIIEERRNLLQKIAAKEKVNGNRKLASTYTKRAAELEQQINHLKETLFRVERD